MRSVRKAAATLAFVALLANCSMATENGIDAPTARMSTGAALTTPSADAQAPTPETDPADQAIAELEAHAIDIAADLFQGAAVDAFAGLDEIYPGVSLTVLIDDGGGQALVQLGLYIDVDVANSCPDAGPLADTCKLEKLPDGGELMTQGAAHGRADEGERQERFAGAWLRTMDNQGWFSVTAIAFNAPSESGEGTRDEPPLTADELAVVVRDERWVAVVPAVREAAGMSTNVQVD